MASVDVIDLFYDGAGKAHCVIRTDERRPYGRYMVGKGAIPSGDRGRWHDRE